MPPVVSSGGFSFQYGSASLGPTTHIIESDVSGFVLDLCSCQAPSFYDALTREQEDTVQFFESFAIQRCLEHAQDEIMAAVEAQGWPAEQLAVQIGEATAAAEAACAAGIRRRYANPDQPVPFVVDGQCMIASPEPVCDPVLPEPAERPPIAEFVACYTDECIVREGFENALFANYREFAAEGLRLRAEKDEDQTIGYSLSGVHEGSLSAELLSRFGYTGHERFERLGNITLNGHDAFLRLAQTSGRIPFFAVTTSSDGSRQSRLLKKDLAAYSLAYPSAIMAGHQLEIGDRVTVVEEDGGHAPVSNIGNGQTVIGGHAQVGSVSAYGPILLRNYAVVDGDVVATNFVTQEGASVMGGMFANRTLAPAVPVDIGSVSSPGGMNVEVFRDQVVPLMPGSYGRIVVHGGADLVMVGGDYSVREFVLQSGAEVRLAVDDEPIVLAISDRATWSSQVRILDEVGNEAGPRDLTLLYTGAERISLESTFRGLLLAPNAQLRLAVGGQSHEGQFFARSVHVDPDVRITRVPLIDRFAAR